MKSLIPKKKLYHYFVKNMVRLYKLDDVLKKLWYERSAVAFLHFP